jgi:hypothetical protein
MDAADDAADDAAPDPSLLRVLIATDNHLGGRARTPGCQIGVVDHTGWHVTPLHSPGGVTRLVTRTIPGVDVF